MIMLLWSNRGMEEEDKGSLMDVISKELLGQFIIYIYI